MRTVVAIVFISSAFGGWRASQSTPPATPTPTPAPSVSIPDRSPNASGRWNKDRSESAPKPWNRVTPATPDAANQQESLPLRAIPEESEVIIFRGTYIRSHRVRGCIPAEGGGRAMLATGFDDFKVVEVIKGQLTATDVTVRSGLASSRFMRAELKVGTTYTLRLTPSALTKGDLRDRPSVVVPGDELAIIDEQ